MVALDHSQDGQGSWVAGGKSEIANEAVESGEEVDTFAGTPREENHARYRRNKLLIVGYLR